MATELTHLDESGAARMVDVGQKPVTQRSATATAQVRMAPETLQQVRQTHLAKGDVLQVARVAGVMAAKRTAELIPLCHSLPLDAVRVDFDFQDEQTLLITGQAEVTGKTGVEMEALTAVTASALTVYDMCKAIDRGIVIGPVQLEEKRGGRSGHWRRGDTDTSGKERQP